MKRLLLRLFNALLIVTTLIGCEEYVVKNDDIAISTKGDYVVIESDEHFNDLVNKTDHYTQLPVKSEGVSGCNF